MNAYSPVHRPFLALLLTALLVSTAAAQLSVTPPAEESIIGTDMVLELSLPAAVGSNADGLEATIDVLDGEGEVVPGLIEKGLRLKATGQPGQFTLTATTARAATPGEHAVKVIVTAADQSYEAESSVALKYGKEWTAERINHKIATSGLPLFLLLVFLAGILMSATPCIYPMIPITLAVIGAQTQDKGVAKGFILALTYGIGLALVYGLIGLLSATVFSGITAFLQSPAVLVPIAVLMVAMAFAMFGAFELEAPAFLRNRLQGAGGSRTGIIGALIAGMVAGLVASPCVGPFLAALLIWIGAYGGPFLGFLSLFIFGLGLSALLVAVGTFPSLMSSMPQSGGWMETVKKGMGLLLLYMAFFFVRPPLVLPESVFFPLLGVVTIIVAAFMGAFDRLTGESHWWDRFRTGLGFVALLVGIFLLARSVLPDLLPAPTAVTQPAVASAGPVGGGTVAAAPLPAKVPWEVIHTGENVMEFIDGKLAEAKAAGQPVMFDFWATWCAYCKKLDKKVWNQAPVIEESLRFTTIKVDATKSDAEMEAVYERFGVSGLPMVVFVDGQGNHLVAKSFNGYKGPDEILSIMKTVE